MFVHEFDKLLSPDREVVARSKVWIVDDLLVSSFNRCPFSWAWSSLSAINVVRQFVGVTLECCVVCVQCRLSFVVWFVFECRKVKPIAVFARSRPRPVVLGYGTSVRIHDVAM
jgi:hypothetical protein